MNFSQRSLLQLLLLGAVLDGVIVPTLPAAAQQSGDVPVMTPVSASALTIVSPTANEVIDVAASSIVLRYQIGQSVELQVNGAAVSDSLIGRTETNKNTQEIIQTWVGVPLNDGVNTVTATIVGQPESRQTTTVQVRGSGTALTLTTDATRIPADGRSTLTVQGQLLDAQGNRSNRDALVTLKPSAGEFVEPDADDAQPGYQVKAVQGEFRATLRSGIAAQMVRIQAKRGDIDAFTQVQFETNLRPSLVTGNLDLRLGKRGTNFYSSFREFLPADRDNRYHIAGSGSVFATGKVGEWLVTGAYNSSRALNQTCEGNRLFRDQQFCDHQYPVYGDASKSEVLTPSIDSVFFKIERSSPSSNGIDSAMWGDYRTEEFAKASQQFTATTRQLHGFKLNYNIGNLQVTGLYGNNIQGFQRDTLLPDGTSGTYFLSRRLVLGGSEDVFLELEELNRPGTVLDRKQLNRGTDYDIDYDRGSLVFKQPILRTDVDRTGQVLVRRIVATYQYENAGEDNSLYAGRALYHLSRKPGQESWIGATYLRENQGNRDFELYGTDAMISLGKGKLIAEYAHATNNSDILGLVNGSAYRLEANGEIAKGIQGRAFYRHADTGFANDATVSFTPGQTRYGAEVTGKISDTTQVRVQYDHEDNKGIAPKPLNTLTDLLTPRTVAIPGAAVDNSLTTIGVGIQQKIGSANLNVDYLHRDRDDRLAPLSSGSSDQLRSMLQMPLTPGISLQVLNETSLSAKSDAIYNDRTAVGLDWAIMPGLNLLLGQQFYTSGALAGKSITNLNLNGEYKVGSDTTLKARYGILGGASDWTTQGAIGINQGWTIAKGLRADFAYEHLFGGGLGRTAAGNQFAQPFAAGQSASALGLQGGDSYSVGLEYTGSKDFQASARYQHRTSSSGTNTVINAAMTGKLSPAITGLVRYQQSGSANQTIVGLDDTANLKVGLAYREPTDDRFNALLRYEYRRNPSSTPDSILSSTGSDTKDHLFGLEAIYAPNWHWEFYGKYALRQSTTSLANDFKNSSTVSLAQLRATYRFSYAWDVSGEARWISQPTADYSELGWMVEAGYYVSPNLRLALGYSFGRVGDRDFDGSRSNGGLYVGLNLKVAELFNGFGIQKPLPKSIQPSTDSSVSPSS
jgi:hypothetical protein